MLYYSIAHYYDISKTNDKRKKETYNHIIKHIEAFIDIKDDKKEFILVSFVDTPREQDHYYSYVKIHLEEFCNKYLPNYKSHVIIEFNWGGTIAALWYTYLFLKSLNVDDSSYIAHFEEDFGPIDDSFYTNSKKLLTDDIVYVGESNTGRIKVADRITGKNDDNRLFHNSKYTRLNTPEVWTDGGYYFSNFYKLKEIENKIGIFHKGDQTSKYHRYEDGISIGEVGFPTLLHHADFKFTCMYRNDYFTNEWLGGH